MYGSLVSPGSSESLRRRVLELILCGHEPADVAGRFGCSPELITDWMADVSAPTESDGLVVPGVEYQELRQLRQAVKWLRIECAILTRIRAVMVDDTTVQ